MMVASCKKQESLPPICYENQHDYSFMWWKNSIKTGNQVFAIKTNRYALSFDYPNLAIQDLSILKEVRPEVQVMRETNDESFPIMSPCQLKFGIDLNGSMSWCDSTSGLDDDCQLVITGKYYQRRFITSLPGMKHCDPYNSGLVISSWPDRLSFILKAIPSTGLKNPGLVTQITFPEKYNSLLEQGNIVGLKNPEDGSGFIVHQSAEATSLEVDGTRVTVKLEKADTLRAGEEINGGMIVYPIASDIDSEIKRIAEEQAQPLVVTAEQISPIESPMNVLYDKDQDWYEFVLRNDQTESEMTQAEPVEGNPGPQEDLNNRIERVLFTVSNPSNRGRVARLNFAKGQLTPGGSPVFSIPGISAVLRDQDGFPVGIPIQLSKNWHGGGRTGISHYYKGSWFYGLTMITIPANTDLTLEYTSVNSLWGGVPAASHAQLSLVGWGSNQQWDQSAIGAWGEMITYEPDLDQASAPVLDFRPMLVRLPNGRKWGWTGNIGGADIFNYTKTDGNRGWHSRIRTHYKRYSPNFTEVTYCGTMDDRSMDFEYTTSVGRSDDLTRGIYRIKLKVNEDISFKDFVVFQAAAETYHFASSNTLAWGNEEGLNEEWAATTGGTSRYITPKQVAEGTVPWFSFTDGRFSTTHQDARFLPANRGFVIREWGARINGVDNVPPWFAEYNTTSGRHGGPSSLINIIPPEYCNRFQKGDYIEAEIELFIIPLHAEDYYGPNQNLAEALKTKANSWELVYREAIGNDLEVEIQSGRLLDSYPIKIEAEDNRAALVITGGMGYVPMVITNLSGFRNPQLSRKVNNSWQTVDQSVHGNDFWQADYNAANGSWDISYNLNLDTPGDERERAEFRFELTD